MRKYRKNTVKGKQKGKKRPEWVKTAVLCDLMVSNNISAVAQKYDVPESTIRTWKAKAEKEPDGGESLWAKARAEQIQMMTHKAAQSANLNLDLIIHRLQAGARNIDRLDDIVKILAGSEKSEGIVKIDQKGELIAAAEIREKNKLTEDLEKELEKELAIRKSVVPNDKALNAYLRTLATIAAQQSGETAGANAENLLAGVQGDEF